MLLLYGAVAIALLTGTYGITIGIKTERISLDVSLSANQTGTQEPDRLAAAPTPTFGQPSSEEDRPLPEVTAPATLSPVEVLQLLQEDAVRPTAAPVPTSLVVTLKPAPTRATTIANDLASEDMAFEVVRIERRSLLASGQAGMTTNRFTTPRDGDWKFSIDFSGPGKFEVRLRETVSSKETILAYALGAFHGEKVVRLETAGQYRLIIVGNGEWSIKTL